jgi:hypothetical protein
VGDWMIRDNEIPIKVTKDFFWDFGVRYYKIILTTDQYLIKDGVQAIDDEFLEWFVKNPSCEGVDVYNDKSVGYEYDHYSIIIPKEEPKKVLTEEDIWSKEDIDAVTDYINKETLSTKLHKGEVVDESYPKEFKQETLEEYIEREGYPEGPTQDIWEQGVREGVKWQAEQLYKDDVIQTLEKGLAVLLKRQERMYSEEDMIAFGEFIFKHSLLAHSKGVKNLFETFKN